MSVRKNQCKACPWKVSTVPDRDIPNGYNREKHANLKNTIARPGDLRGIGGAMHVMACHESPVGDEQPCVGWLVHQLGRGNNIALRLQSLDGRYAGLMLDGEQHETFEATLGLDPDDDDGIDWGDGD